MERRIHPQDVGFSLVDTSLWERYWPMSPKFWHKVKSPIYELVVSFKVEKKKVNVGDGWFRISPLSVCLSVGVPRLLVSSAFFWSVSTVEKFVFCIVFLLWSDQVRFSLFFYRQGHRFAEKLLLIIFIFWQISSTFRYALILCTETPFFHFEESLSTDNIRWVNTLVGALIAIIILCVQKIRNRSLPVI